MSASRKKPGAGSEPCLYRPHEIARTLGCSEWWVKEQARKRRIPFAWIGGSYRFTDEHLAEIIRCFEVRPANPGPADAAQAGTAPSGSARRRPAPTSAPVVRLKARPPRRARHPGSDPSAA